MSARPDVIVREVGLRDGLQSIARVLQTAQKLEWPRRMVGGPARKSKWARSSQRDSCLSSPTPRSL